MLEARDLAKRFRIPRAHRATVREHVLDAFRPAPTEELAVLDGVSFEVAAGETFGIMGRNGSGKSTLLKLIAGIYTRDRGTVVARGAITPILELGIGWNPELDAVDNIMLIGTVMGMSLGELRRSIDEILAFAELEKFANLKLQHYSSGMGSRLTYAVAFRAVRDILILDEVFAVGDAGFKQRCEARFRELRQKGTTTAVVSHDPRTVAMFCDRALLLDRGRSTLIADGPEVAAAYVESLTGEDVPAH